MPVNIKKFFKWAGSLSLSYSTHSTMNGDLLCMKNRPECWGCKVHGDGLCLNHVPHMVRREWNKWVGYSQTMWQMWLGESTGYYGYRKRKPAHTEGQGESVAWTREGDSSEVSLEWYLRHYQMEWAKMMVEGRWQRNVRSRWSHISKGSIIEISAWEREEQWGWQWGPGASLWRTTWLQ